MNNISRVFIFLISSFLSSSSHACSGLNVTNEVRQHLNQALTDDSSLCLHAINKVERFARDYYYKTIELLLHPSTEAFRTMSVQEFDDSVVTCPRFVLVNQTLRRHCVFGNSWHDVAAYVHNPVAKPLNYCNVVMSYHNNARYQLDGLRYDSVVLTAQIVNGCISLREADVQRLQHPQNPQTVRRILRRDRQRPVVVSCPSYLKFLHEEYNLLLELRNAAVVPQELAKVINDGPVHYSDVALEDAVESTPGVTIDSFGVHIGVLSFLLNFEKNGGMAFLLNSGEYLELQCDGLSVIFDNGEQVISTVFNRIVEVKQTNALQDLKREPVTMQQIGVGTDGPNNKIYIQVHARKE